MQTLEKYLPLENNTMTMQQIIKSWKDGDSGEFESGERFNTFITHKNQY